MSIGIIYKIFSTSDPSKIYIGSTNKSIQDRLAMHKAAAASGVNYKFYKYVREVGHATLTIETVLLIPNSTKSLLRGLEGHFIRFYNCTESGLNTYIAGRTHSEWQKEHREKTRLYCKTWRQSHKKPIELVNGELIIE